MSHLEGEFRSIERVPPHWQLPSELFNPKLTRNIRIQRLREDQGYTHLTWEQNMLESYPWKWITELDVEFIFDENGVLEARRKHDIFEKDTTIASDIDLAFSFAHTQGSPDYSYYLVDFDSLYTKGRYTLGGIDYRSRMEYLALSEIFLDGPEKKVILSPDATIRPVYIDNGEVEGITVTTGDLVEPDEYQIITRSTDPEHAEFYLLDREGEMWYAINCVVRSGRIRVEQEYLKDEFDGKRLKKVIRAPINVPQARVVNAGVKDSFEGNRLLLLWRDLPALSNNPSVGIGGPIHQAWEKMALGLLGE